MEPKIPSPEAAPAQPPISPEYQPSPERAIEAPARSPEQAIERAPEQHHATTATSLPTPIIALPAPVPIQPAEDSQAQPADDTPLVAADEDLIEKEWVDKAKKIISETKDDPHAREREVGRLQADYLRKRYGKELGEPS